MEMTGKQVIATFTTSLGMHPTERIRGVARNGCINLLCYPRGYHRRI